MAHQKNVGGKGETMKAGEAVAHVAKKEPVKIGFVPKPVTSTLLKRKAAEWKNAVLVSGTVKT